MSLTFLIWKKEQGKRRKEYRVETMRREERGKRESYERSIVYVHQCLFARLPVKFRTIRALHRLCICIYMWQHLVYMHERTTTLFHEKHEYGMCFDTFFLFSLLYTWYTFTCQLMKVEMYSLKIQLSKNYYWII